MGKSHFVGGRFNNFGQLSLIFSICWMNLLLHVCARQNFKSFTRSGIICKTDCEQQGYSYAWCRKRDDSWDYCSSYEWRDIYGSVCKDECKQHGKSSYTTCKNYEGPIEDCGVNEQSGCPTNIKEGSPSRILKASGVHKEGDWGDTEFCPPNEFVIGLQLLSQPFSGIGIGKNDDYALVGIKFYCSHSWKNITNPNCYISSDYFIAGGAKWTPVKYCQGGLAKGFQLKTWESQGTWDDLGATNFRLLCSDETILTFDLEYEEGEWPRSYESCPEKQSICGIRTKTETGHQNDDTGLNAVEIYCCKRKVITTQDIAQECEPSLKWELVAFADNRLGTTSKKYTYFEKVGASQTDTLRNLERDSSTSGKEDTWGVENELELGSELFTPGVKNTLKLRFDQKMSTSKANENEKETGLSKAFDKETQHQIEVEVLPGVEFSLYQYIGTCGPFVVRPYMFNRTDIRHNPIKRNY